MTFFEQRVLQIRLLFYAYNFISYVCEMRKLLYGLNLFKKFQLRLTMMNS